MELDKILLSNGLTCLNGTATDFKSTGCFHETGVHEEVIDSNGHTYLHGLKYIGIHCQMDLEIDCMCR